MGKAVIKNQTTPVTPTSGYTAIFVDSADKKAKQIDDTGTVTDLTATTTLDYKAKVSSNDTTGGYLNGKLVAGTNITFTENNDGGNETLTIASTASGGASDSSDTIIAGEVFC